MKKIYGLILLAVITFSCGDDDGPKLTVEQYLTAASNGWVLDAVLVKEPGTGNEVDVIDDADFKDALGGDCALDDATIFTTDGKYTVANNVKCDSSDPSTVDTGNWSLNSDKTSLTIDSDDDDPFTLTKLSVNDTELRGEVGDFFGSGLNVTLVMKKK